MRHSLRCALLALVMIFGARFAGAQSLLSTHVPGGAFGANVDLSAVSATTTETSSPYIDSGFFKQAELYVTWASVTGSPSGCTIQVKASGNGSTFINSGAAIGLTPGTNLVSVFTGALGEQVEYAYSCSTYPTAGTLTLTTIYK